MEDRELCHFPFINGYKDGFKRKYNNPWRSRKRRDNYDLGYISCLSQMTSLEETKVYDN